MKIAKNEMVLKDSRFSILKDSEQTESFLSANTIYESILMNDDSPVISKFRQQYTLPAYHLEIALDDNMYYSERQAYGVLTLLGDFGGFNDAIFMVVGALIGYYSEKMFLKSITDDMNRKKPVKMENSKKLLQDLGLKVVAISATTVNEDPMIDQPNEALNRADLKVVATVMQSAKNLK